MEARTEQIEALEKEILEAKKRLKELRRAQPRTPVQNYSFQGQNGEVTLSELFANRPDLLVIHNMGESCRFCTLWADGLNGVLDHLQNRTEVVMVTPDPVDRQKRFGESRGWRFRMVRDASGDFSKALGMHGAEAGSFWPGATGLRSEGGSILRIASAPFGEGDDFCATWHLLDLLAEGWNGWEPQYAYS